MADDELAVVRGHGGYGILEARRKGRHVGCPCIEPVSKLFGERRDVRVIVIADRVLVSIEVPVDRVKFAASYGPKKGTDWRSTVESVLNTVMPLRLF